MHHKPIKEDFMFSILRRTIVNKVEMSIMVFESTFDNKVVTGTGYLVVFKYIL